MVLIVWSFARSTKTGPIRTVTSALLLTGASVELGCEDFELMLHPDKAPLAMAATPEMKSRRCVTVDMKPKSPLSREAIRHESHPPD
jgi:hypothetical protein